MKKLFFMLFVLFIIYLGFQTAFYYFSDNELNTYKLNKDNIEFNITESANFKSNNNYNYNISVDGIDFNFQIFKDYKKSIKLIKDIKYYKDDNTLCILPIFKEDNILIDMICLTNGEYNYYRNIKGSNSNLDKYVNEIDEYDINRFVDNKESTNIEGLNVYRENLIKDHYLALDNYKGIYIISNNINSTVYNISLFNKDVYNQEVGIYYKNYYIVADYNNKNTFNELKVIDLIELNIFNIKSDYDLSFDSTIYIEDNKLYLTDNDNSKTYEIDIKNKHVIRTSLEKNMKSLELDKEVRINDVGYKYTFVKDNDKYKVYRTDLNGKGKIYLFNTTSLENINFVDDYVYFMNEDYIYVYNDNFGILKILSNEEIKFNNNLKFYVHKK